MTTEILTKLHLTSWEQASAWAKNRRYPCEECVEYDREQKCEYYQLCKEGGKQNAIAFFTRTPKPKPAETKPKPYRPNPRRGSVLG